jgi:ribonuclease HI
MSFYAVAKGHNIGIYYFWNDCKEQVIGYKGAIYKKFSTETEAEDYILNINSVSTEFFENIYSKFDDSKVDYFVYTDGSCYNNGKINAISAIGIFFEENNNKNISKIVDSLDFNHTNNSAELLAILQAYELIKDDLVNKKKISIVTDSDYSIKCATSYGEKCEKHRWNKNIPNKNLVKQLYMIYKANPNLKLKHIKAHTNAVDIHSLGNKEADKLAYNAIKEYKKF